MLKLLKLDLGSCDIPHTPRNFQGLANFEAKLEILFCVDCSMLYTPQKHLFCLQ